MAALISDLRYAFRMLRKSPGFTAAAVITLALGIGANSTIFSVMNATLLKRLPFPQPERLVLLWKTYGPGDYNIVSAPNFWDWQQQSHSFERLALFDSAGKGFSIATQRNGEDAEQVSGVRVTADFFNVLGIAPLLGRGFLAEEETLGKDHEVVLSYGLWQRRFGGDRALLGQTIKLDGEDYTVVGIMPRSFNFQFWSDPRELWVPVGWTQNDRGRGGNSFVAIARLKPGVTLAQANTELRTIQERLAQQYREEVHSSAAVVPVETYGLENIQRLTLALLTSVGLVLLIGCINVANLMLARGAERRKEFAIRRALGASGTRLLRQLLAESVLLALVGGAVGLGLAVWGTALLTRILPPNFSFLPFRPLDAVTLDVRVLAFTLAVSCVAGVLFGLAPGFTAARSDVNAPLKEGGRSSHAGRTRFRYVLVAAEVGLAVIVLCAAGLMIKSMARLLAVDPGFKPRELITLQVSTPQVNTYVGPPTHPRFCQLLDEQIGNIAGVESVSAAAHLPMRGDAGRSFAIVGRPLPAPGEEPSAHYTVACPNYFRTLGVPLLRGREFTHQDTLGSSGVVIINQALAEKYWPNQDAIGQRITQDPRDPKEPVLTVIGTVGNVRHWGLASKPAPQMFRVYTQAAWPTMSIVARTRMAPVAFMAVARQALAIVEPTSAPARARTMEQTVRGSLGSRRFPMLLLSAFAALALLLAAVGIVGVVSYSVSQRTHELGIRIALGAHARDVLTLVLGGSLKWVLFGVAAGIAGSFAATRLLNTLLYDVKPSDPAVLAIVCVALTSVAFAASYAPARRATRVDPMVALRQD
jgi:putative ABC transport system permease protein